MLITKTEDIYSYIKNNPNFTVLVAETVQLESLLIQNLRRFNKDYLSLINIVVYPEFRGTGLLKSIVSCLEETKRPILIDDICNEKLYSFFEKRGYSFKFYYKNNTKINCMIKN